MPCRNLDRPACLVRALAACLLAAAALGAQTGVWENITPAGINLSPDFPSTANGYGVQDVLADPIHPGTFYAFVCYQGCWKSSDWGASWAKVDTDGKLEGGRPWGEAIAPDGSYMLACSGYNPAGGGGAWKSTNGGVTWTSYAIPDPDGYNDPYNFDIDPGSAQHVLASMHGSAIIWESLDGGQTWANRGSPAGSSPYVFFLTSTSWLAIPGWDDTSRTMRTTNSGTSWTAVSPTALYNGNLPMEHFHGNEQIAIVPGSGDIYVPSETGIYRSTDGGASFTQVNGAGTSTVFATATTLYAEYAWALNSSPVTPGPLSSPIGSGTSWTAMPTPPLAMTNGAKRAAVAYNAGSASYVIISGNWTAGIWRYIEPSAGTPPPAAAPAPTISALSPASGAAGTTITITGSNLGGTTTVTIGGVNVPFTVNPAGTAITITVTAATPSGPVVVTTPAGSATSTTPFAASAAPAGAAPASAESSSSPHRCGHGGIAVLVLLLSCAAWRATGARTQLSSKARR